MVVRLHKLLSDLYLFYITDDSENHPNKKCQLLQRVIGIHK